MFLGHKITKQWHKITEQWNKTVQQALNRNFQTGWYILEPYQSVYGKWICQSPLHRATYSDVNHIWWGIIKSHYRRSFYGKPPLYPMFPRRWRFPTATVCSIKGLSLRQIMLRCARKDFLIVCLGKLKPHLWKQSPFVAVDVQKRKANFQIFKQIGNIQQYKLSWSSPDTNKSSLLKRILLIMSAKCFQSILQTKIYNLIKVSILFFIFFQQKFYIVKKIVKNDKYCHCKCHNLQGSTVLFSDFWTIFASLKQMGLITPTSSV